MEAILASEGEPCEASLGSRELASGAVGEVQVWGDRALARTEDDLLFLVELEEGWKVATAGCRSQGGRRLSLLQYVASSDFAVNVAENWQSEFLAVGSLAVLSVYLRQRGSPESKPVVGTSHATTEKSG
ncbi:DUF6766 family protein [Glycomyces sp. YM15]|uniref:DUF6766 family protein n=1 Tax=Glycomyces sp. YM15 TaxID=2800446 RepID=UPI0019625937|nr:DUF6766 family protein [Glycomyces sp. YM15]